MSSETNDPEKFPTPSPESAAENKGPQFRQYMSACNGRQVSIVTVGPAELTLAAQHGDGMPEILDEVAYAFLDAYKNIQAKVEPERLATAKYVFLMTFDEGNQPVADGDPGPEGLELG
jgi:hypothetical protein